MTRQVNKLKYQRGSTGKDKCNLQIGVAHDSLKIISTSMEVQRLIGHCVDK